MKAIIWKEWRENLKWAVMLCLGVSAAMAYALYVSYRSAAVQHWGGLESAARASMP